MRQIAILPSGCQLDSKYILYDSDSKLIYASTLAIYILNANTFVLEKVMAISDRAITSFCISPHDDDLLIVASIDGFIRLWSIKDEELITTVNTGLVNSKSIVCWSLHSPDHCAVIASEPHLRIISW